MNQTGRRTREDERHIVSLLARFWLEPRETEGGPSPLRGYVRHLQTGEERYFSDPNTIVDYVLRRLEDEDAGAVAGGPVP